MTSNKLDRLIFEAALELFHEQESENSGTDKKADKKTKFKSEAGSKISVAPLGGGRWKKEIRLGRSRAVSDSHNLVRELGIKTKGTGSTDAAKAASVFMQAVNNNDVMSDAFGDLSKAEVDDEQEIRKSGYSVKHATELSKRNATMYLYITLLAAEQAGFLKLEKGIAIADWHYVERPTFYDH